VALYGSFDPDEGFDGSRETIGHELEFAVWGNERYSSIVLKP
jgi:hypothetical protein